jgi:superfamily II DNA helicase RecQ
MPPVRCSLPSLSANQGDVLLQLLQEFLGDSSAQFRSAKQRTALLYLLLNKHPSMFIILPTGGGKSTFVLLCASLAFPQVTIIIVPLVALKHNLTQKAKQLGLDVQIWEQMEEQALTRASCDLVLVSLETAANHAFARIVCDLIERDKISQIIFDEAHLIDTQKGFRQNFYKLSFLGSLSVPLFFASATLTSASVNRIRSMLHLRESKMIQADISNPNITYIVEDYPSATRE